MFEEVNEAYTTQTCSCCGSRCSSPKGRAGLGIREWTCLQCGTLHDRDVNAAKNILALGHERLGGGITVLKDGDDVNLTRWLNKTENPEKHIYYIRETNNKFNRLSKSHDKLKSEHKIIKEIFNSFYTLNEETKSANDLCTEITRLRNLEFLLNQYKQSKNENDLKKLLKF